MFGHLQVYSGYSFQESTMLTKDIVLKAQALNQKAIALTDQNNLFGMVEFYKLCQQANIKPIIGMEASIEVDQEIYPFVLLAKDTQGYFNICQISTKIQVEGYYSIEKLAEFKEHLVILTPGQNGLIERLLTKELYNEALRYFEKFRQLFGQSFYIDLHNHQIALQEKVNQQLKSLAQILNIKIVVSNQVSYLEKKDALALDLVNASKKSMTFNQKHELLTNQKYLKSTQEMEALFDHELIDETINFR